MVATPLENATENAPRRLRPDDIFNLSFIGDVTISPDGRTVCYVYTRMDRAANEYRSDLWIVPAGGAVGNAVRFTRDPRTVAQPRYSPDGRWLAFLSDRAEKGKKQLYVIPTGGAGGEARAVTADETGVGEFVWSPDSTRFAFTRGEKVTAAGDPAPKPALPPDTERVTDDVLTITRIRNKADGRGFIHDRRSHLWTTTLDGIETRLTQGDADCSSPAWSPDGTQLVFVSKRGQAEPDFTNANDLWTISADGGEPCIVPTPDGPLDVPAWSPDGAHIAYVGSDRPNVAGAVSDLWIVAVGEGAGGAARNITAGFNRNIGLDVGSDSRAGLSGTRPVWTPDSAALVFLASTEGETPLWRVAVAGGTPERIGQMPLPQVQSFAFGADGNACAFNLGGPTNPGDVYIAAGNSAAPRRLTDANGAFFVTVEIVTPEPFAFRGAEGWNVGAWLLKPAGYRDGAQYPLVLEIHGGPHTAYGNMFMFEFQLLAAQGWGVLAVNPRGSTGYGERFTMASNDDWGGNDYRDLMAGVDAALERAPWVDEARLGVTGGSYGGYMTNWIVTQTGRFRAAVTQRSICNMVSKWGVSDIGYFGNDLQWGGPPWENMAFYLDRSPLTHVQKVTTPLLILHSERDLRCPIEQGEQFFTALKYLRREVEFVRFPDEGHELSRSGQPLHRLERLNRIVGWFAGHL